jgi:hypothetical protein
MAITMIGGLISSTIFTLVALPVWYTTIEDFGAVFVRALPRVRVEGARPRVSRGVLADRDGS